MVVAFNLNSAETLLSEVLRIVHVDHVLVVLSFFAIHAYNNRLAILAKLLLGGLLLQGQDLALGEVLEVNLAVGQTIVVNELLLLLVAAILRQLIDLILD